MLKDVNAEMLLEYLYPGMEDRWIVHCKGTFYRNYNDDAMSVDPSTGVVNLARDGFFNLLPDTLFTKRDELRGKEYDSNYEALQQRKNIFKEVFSVFDTFVFRDRLAIERHVSDLLDSGLDHILETYFGINRNEVDPIVAKVAAVLPFVSRVRGNLGFVRELLSVVTGCSVELDLSHRHSVGESVSVWMPEAVFSIICDGLDSGAYRSLAGSIGPLCDFVREWLVPFDVFCDIRIRSSEHACGLSEGLLLDYNCVLNK